MPQNNILEQIAQLLGVEFLPNNILPRHDIKERCENYP